MRNRLEEWMCSIQAKLFIYFTILFVLFLGSMIVFYSISMNNIYRLTTESVENSLNQINIDTNRVLAAAQNVAVNVANNSAMQISLRKKLPDTEKEIYKERLDYNNSLFYTLRGVENIDGIYVIGENGAIYRSYYGLKQTDYRNEEWYKEVMHSGKTLWMEPHNGSAIARNLDMLTISIVVPIKDKASTNLLGVVVVDVLVKNLKPISEGGIVFEGNTYILNEGNKIIYVNNEDISEKTIQNINEELSKIKSSESNKAEEFVIGGQKYLAELLNLADSRWKIMGLISYKKMYAQAEIFRNIIIVSITFFAVVSVIFAVVGSHSIAKPIRDILTTMKEVEKGNFSVRIKDAGKDEVGDLARGFNHMVYKVNKLMEKERDTQQKLMQAEFNALQAQLNPHFLYNTLDSINWMARMNQIDKVEKMIDSLTGFLRIGLSRGRDFITLQEEMKHVESYISIQKIRYDRILDYEIKVPEGLKKYIVIKMILQPLVENSIYHGIKEQDEHGTISISVEETKDTLILCVADDGLGMKPERLAQIREIMEKCVGYNEDVYGVINVQRRIQTYFGKEYGLDFRSEYGKGTQVFITLPKREVTEKNA